VLVTPTGISKSCGYVSLCLPFRGVPTLLIRIVEFQKDSQRTIRELSEHPLLHVHTRGSL
jgi:hypothetical protein